MAANTSGAMTTTRYAITENTARTASVTGADLPADRGTEARYRTRPSRTLAEFLLRNNAAHNRRAGVAAGVVPWGRAAVGTLARLGLLRSSGRGRLSMRRSPPDRRRTTARSAGGAELPCHIGPPS